MKELKSVQTIILLTPSMKANLCKLAHMNRMNLSEFIRYLIDEYIQAHPDLISQYDGIYGVRSDKP